MTARQSLQPLRRWPAALALAGATALAIVPDAPAQTAQGRETGRRIALTPGLAIVETLHFAGGDRESVTTIDELSAAGVRYVWRFVEVRAAGDTIREELTRFVSAADLAGASRLHTIWEQEATERPGYTTNSLSTAVYRQLVDEASAPFALMVSGPPRGADGPLAALGIAPAGRREVPRLWRGTLTRMSASPEPFPLLVDGRRIAVPALHLRGRFTSRGRQWEPELWILADSVYPMLLRIVRSYPETENVLQTVRVDLPAGGRVVTDAAGREIENALAADCRVELPGIYFAFDSAELDPASDGTIARLAGIIARHPDWSVTLEGHTDSIGSAASNRLLSERRAQAVRERLASRHGIDATRLPAAGYGAAHPLESNATIEGRARNRRVELVRDCAGRAGVSDEAHAPKAAAARAWPAFNALAR